MKIPEFKLSKRYLRDINLSCLAATVKNSELPGVATQHIAEFKEDTTCEIYLRGKNPEEICAWQQAMLERLFEKEGLAAAVTEGMKDYETACMPDDPYADFYEEERQQIKEHSIAPFLIIDCVVIDAIEEKVLIGADNIASVFHEHLITIYLSEGRWRFADGDHYSEYKSNVKEQQPSKCKSWLKSLGLGG